MKSQSFLEKFDDFIHMKSAREARLLSLGAAILVAFLIYTFSFDASQNFRDRQSLKNSDLQAKISAQKLAMSDLNRTNFSADIHDENNQTAKLKERLEMAKNENMIFDAQLKELSFMLFNDQNWAKFLDDLVVLAKEHKVAIKNITNEPKNPTFQKVEQLASVSVIVEGEFAGILGYINAIENSRLLTDITSLNIAPMSSWLSAKIDVAVWGVRY